MTKQVRPRRVVVYTAIAGKYDALTPISSLWAKEATFTAFVDGELPAGGWQLREMEYSHVDPCRRAKFYKLLPHRVLAFDYCIWIDGCVQVNSQVPLISLLEDWLKDADVAVFRHRTRNCIYDEAQACIRSFKDDPAIIESQTRKYRYEGHPAGAGLHECTVLVRRNTLESMRLSEAWFAEVSVHSRRDQLSFDYVVRRTGVKVSDLPGTIDSNQHFLWLPHSNDPHSSGRAQRLSGTFPDIVAM